MHPLERATLDHILDRHLFEPSAKKIVTGVSGGPDSVALLSVLASLQSRLGVAIIAVYVNHGLRPLEAKNEEEYVRSLSGALATGFERVSVDVRSYARGNKLSLENAARDLRYDAFRKISTRCGADCIAVAHTADDQAEEILIRLLRGGGRKGLSGMRGRTGGVIRPFLQIEKQRIFKYLQEKNIQYCLDSMNNDMRYLRNRVRSRLIPYLEENFDSGVRKALCKTADSLAEDEALLENMTNQALEKVVMEIGRDPNTASSRVVLDRQGLTSQPPALQRRIIEKILWQVGSRAGYAHILQIIDAAAKARAGSELHLSRGLRFGVRKEYLELLYPQGKSSWRGRLYGNNDGGAVP